MNKFLRLKKIYSFLSLVKRPYIVPSFKYLFIKNSSEIKGLVLKNHRQTNNFQPILFENKLNFSEKIVNIAPVKVEPYLKLIRLDKPTGSWLIIWPSIWGVALATAPGCLPDPILLSLFVTGSFIMRGAGCTINDMIDKDIDSKVLRTMNRPLVNGTINMRKASIFLVGQLSLALLILLQLNMYSVVLGASCMGLVCSYPIMKRITYWPQVFLGLTLNWGILVGYAAVKGSLEFACIPLFSAAVFWTLIYDTIYAHQDKEDDIKIGIKSTAIKFKEKTKIWLTSFSLINLGFLSFCGILAEQTWPFYSAISLSYLHLLWQIYAVDLDNPTDCGKKHKFNKTIGMLVCLGIIFGNLLKKNKNKIESYNQKNSLN